MRLAQRKKTSLAVYRRHEASCPHKKQGREWTKCNCPLWMQGVHDGQPVRQSLSTRSMQEALRQVALLEDPHATQLKPVRAAVEAYQRHIQPLEARTRRRYATTLKPFLAYCQQERLNHMSDIRLEDVDRFRETRKLAPATSAKELTILRMFFTFCQKRKWIAENPAEEIQAPRNQKPPEVVPFEPNEIVRILAACDGIGHSRYEGSRARPLILLMRYTGLRISDAVTLSKDRIKDGQIFLHTKKTGGMVFLPVPKQLENELAALPAPRGAGPHPKCWFWNEASPARPPSKAWSGACGRSSGAPASSAPTPTSSATRSRRRSWRRGGTEQGCGRHPGISPSVVRKHYAKWSVNRQDRITRCSRRCTARLSALLNWYKRGTTSQTNV